MDVIPKKLVESSSRSFFGLSAYIAKDKIYIFGKCSLDIAEGIVNDGPVWTPLVISSCHAF